MRYAQRAEEIGFTFAAISDHFHPWIDQQGHSPFVWGVLGAVAQATERIEVITGVTAPIIRTHPAIVAHAAATCAQLFEGRFSFGLGTGEHLNEHVLGDKWPRAGIRRAMLEEAIDVMRKLWKGENTNHSGRFYTVENARIYDAPDRPIPLLIAASGDKALELAGEKGDGLISLLRTPRRSARSTKPEAAANPSTPRSRTAGPAATTRRSRRRSSGGRTSVRRVRRPKSFRYRGTSSRSAAASPPTTSKTSSPTVPMSSVT